MKFGDEVLSKSEVTHLERALVLWRANLLSHIQEAGERRDTEELHWYDTQFFFAKRLLAIVQKERLRLGAEP